MIELEVENFQSIRSASMKVDGFAAIVGKSNIGKSALVRAAQYALTGAVGTNFVRHGQDCDRRVKNNKKCRCFSKVVIRTSKMEITWEKGDNVNRYTVIRSGSDTPETYNGLDRGTPEFLLPDFQLVKVGDSKELIQIPDQFEPIFLLNQSGPAVADVLSDVARLDRINLAMSYVAKDRKEMVARRKVRDEDVLTLKASLAKYDGLDDVPVDPLLEDLQRLTAKRDLLKRLDGFIARAQALKVDVLGLGEALKPTVPIYDPLEASAKALDQIARFWEEYGPLNEAIVLLETALENSLPDYESLEEVSVALLRVDGFVTDLAEKGPALKKLLEVDKASVPADTCLQKYNELALVDGLLTRSEAIAKQVGRWDGLDAEVPEIDLVKVPVDQLIKVEDLINRGKILAEAGVRLGQEHKAAIEAEEELLKELEALGVCPTCDRPLGSSGHLHLEESA